MLSMPYQKHETLWELREVEVLPKDLVQALVLKSRIGICAAWLANLMHLKVFWISVYTAQVLRALGTSASSGCGSWVFWVEPRVYV